MATDAVLNGCHTGKPGGTNATESPRPVMGILRPSHPAFNRVHADRRLLNSDRGFWGYAKTMDDPKTEQSRRT